MAEPLKYMYNDSFFESFSQEFQKVNSSFKPNLFLSQIYSDNWDDKELKERMRHITLVLNKHLPSDFNSASRLIMQMVNNLNPNGETMSFEYMFFPDYIEYFGIDDFDSSINAMEVVTCFASCEFAIRPFLIKYPEKTLQQLLKWSKNSNAMVRRLATEGSRPRLPWAMALPDFKKDPNPIIPILENCKSDPSEIVRRSVANNINDISKDNPDIATNLIINWYGKSVETDKLLKHGARTMLKEGRTEMMNLFGFFINDKIKVSEFKIAKTSIEMGSHLEFSFAIKNGMDRSAKLRLEYAIYFQKANQSLSKKVFKISETEYQQNELKEYTKKHSFKYISTRKYHKGLHRVSLILNGKELECLDFYLE